VRNLYDVLGVKKTDDASIIKKSFKKLAKKYHPDVSKEPSAEEHFKEINAAYAVIGDEKRRADYDEFGESSLQQGFDAEKARAYGRRGGGMPPGYGSGGVSLDEMLGSLFGAGAFRGSAFQGFDPYGGRGQRPRKGRDLRASITIDLLDAVRGGEVPISVGGGGDSRRLNVKTPAGVKDGQSIRLRGQGEPGPAGAGDILLEIKVRPHSLLSRDGDDLAMDVPISFAESLTGGPITVPTPWGDVKVKIPAGASSGARLRLKGKGVKTKAGAGDLYLLLRPTPPAGVDPEEAAALAESLATLYSDDVRSTLVF